MGRWVILWGCRSLENAFFWLGDFFEDWGDSFDDDLHAELREAMEEVARGETIEIEICPYCGRFDLPDEDGYENHMETVDVDIKKYANEGTINVAIKHFKHWKIRVWVGMRLMRLAAWIMWCNIEFKEAVPFNRAAGLGSITEQPCQCLCDWTGTVWDCEGDVDGDGGLGCPECGRVVELIIDN